MTASPAVGTSTARVLLVDGGQALDVFEVVELVDGLARVKTAFLFELGEELQLRVEQGGAAYEVSARVRSHAGTDTDKVTELELGERSGGS